MSDFSFNSPIFLARLAVLGLIAFVPSGLRAADAPPVNAQLQPPIKTVTVDATSRVPTAEEYRAMQDNATEDVVLRIVSVKTTAAVASEPNALPGAALAVAARAAVLNVTRTATGLKAGDVITLYYGYVPLKPNADKTPTAPPTPVVLENTDYRAYLAGGPEDKGPYRAAAGARSFLDPQAPETPAAAAAPAQARPVGPLADPTLLPTPTNPKPQGANTLRLASSGVVPPPADKGLPFDQFVKLVRPNGQWAVSIANSDPIPLQVIGDATPVPLYYYGAPLHTPAGQFVPPTQPVILIYRAGVQPPTPPATRAYTIERALIVDRDKHLLGDVLWAPRAPDDGQPPPLLPAWTWFTYKLEIIDPDTNKVQTVLLTGPPAAAPSAAGAPSAASGATK